MAKVIYLPGSPQSTQVQAVVQSSSMPFENYGGDIVPADGFTYENVQAYCNVFNYNLSSPYYIFLIMAETYRDPMTAQYIQTTNRGVLICFETDAKVYTKVDPVTDQPYNFAYWWSDSGYTSRVNVKYLYGYNAATSQYQWHINTIQDSWTNNGSASVGNFASNCDIYVMAATVPFEWSGTPYTPTNPDYRFFAKLYDSYTLSVGVAVDENSEAQPHYYITRDYKITLRWTSLKNGESYSYPLSSLKKQVISEIQFTEGIFGGIAFNYTTEIGDIARGLRIPEPGTYDSVLIPSAYEDLTDIRSYNEVTLTELVNYMQTQDAGTTEQDIFTEIFADFIVNNEVIDTKSVSYTSLFGTEDIDIGGGTIQDPNDLPSIDDTNVYTDEIDLTVPTLTGTGVFNRCYVLDANGVNDLCDYLYNANDSIFDEIIDGVLTRGNPIESLIDLRLYPFDVRNFTGAGTAESIKFGRTDTGIIGTKLPHNANAVISLGSAVVPRFKESFLDYHMDVKLYIPFCGVCDLPVDRVLNHEISIKLIVDYITGACTAVVFCDKLPIMYQPGVIGVSIPMTATNSAEFGKTIIGNLVTGAKAAASKDPAAAAEAVGSTASALWEGSHIQSVGSSSPQTALYQPKNAYLLMSIANVPEGVYDTTYANNIGYACFMPMNQIGFMDGKGFVAFDNVKLDIPQATEAEKAELLQLLKAGVFM